MLWSRTESPLLAALSVLIQLGECVVLGWGSHQQHLEVRSFLKVQQRQLLFGEASLCQLSGEQKLQTGSQELALEG